MPTRRTFLKGVTLGAGSLAATQILRQLEIHAQGNAAALPKRFVFCIKSSGLPPASVRPSTIEVGDGSRLVDVPLRDHRLPETLEALEPFKNETMILEGLSGAN